MQHAACSITNTGSETTTYQYDGRKERVYAYNSSSGAKTLYLHGINDYPLMVKTSDGTDRFYIYGPTGLIAIAANTLSDWNFVHKDHLGTTKLIVNSSGNAISRYEYDPYGKIVNAQESPDPRYKFTGQELERDFSTSSFWNFRARMYDSEIGLFYATDPAKESFSPYGYAVNNPISFVDPTGRTSEKEYQFNYDFIMQATADFWTQTLKYDGFGHRTPFTDAGGSPYLDESYEASFARMWGDGWEKALVNAGWEGPVGKSYTDRWTKSTQLVTEQFGYNTNDVIDANGKLSYSPNFSVVEKVTWTLESNGMQLPDNMGSWYNPNQTREDFGLLNTIRRNGGLVNNIFTEASILKGTKYEPKYLGRTMFGAGIVLNSTRLSVDDSYHVSEWAYDNAVLGVAFGVGGPAGGLIGISGAFAKDVYFHYKPLYEFMEQRHKELNPMGR